MMEQAVEEFAKEEIELALRYSEVALFEASLGSEGEVVFNRTPLPEEMSDAMKEEIDFVADYYQRTIFNMELDSEEAPDPKIPDFDDPLEEINFKLDYYKSEFETELRKTLGVSIHRQLNPYSRMLMQYSAEILAKEKKEKES